MATFTCARCGGVFGKVWTDDEAAAEFEEVFPDDDLSRAAVVCDDCFKALGLDDDA